MGNKVHTWRNQRLNHHLHSHPGWTVSAFKNLLFVLEKAVSLAAAKGKRKKGHLSPELCFPCTLRKDGRGIIMQSRNTVGGIICVVLLV